MDNIFIQLAIILGLASVLGFITHKFKLPLLIAYLLGGLLLATVTIFDLKHSEALNFLPEIGIAFVLFLVGMELDLREIKRLGRPILLSSTLQIIISSIAGFVIAQTLGFPPTEALYLGIGLSFSSTIVVIKLLLEKNELNSLYGKLAVGILLLEDLIAVLILLGLTVSPSFFHFGFQQAFPIVTFILKVVLLFGTALVVNRYVLRQIFDAVSESTELLFLTALAWCFIYVSFALSLGFSVVIGAFLAGIGLASSPYHYQIQGKVKPLRDFFVTLFFVYLGTQVNFADLSRVYPVIIVFTVYAVLAKPVIFLLVLGSFGFRKHTMFQTAVNLSNISEFSLIILLVGLKMGLVSQTSLTVIALSLIISTIISSLMVSKSNRLYRYVKDVIAFFERKNYQNALELREEGEFSNHVVVVGAHRVGGEIVKFLKKEGIAVIVLDFNPHLVETLVKEKIPVIYGDIGDPEVLDSLNLEQARMIISTSPSIQDNKTLLEELTFRNINVPIIVRADTAQTARSLYKAGADYVIIPNILAGDWLLQLIKDHFHDGGYFKDRARIEMEKLHKKTLAWE